VSCRSWLSTWTLVLCVAAFATLIACSRPLRIGDKAPPLEAHSWLNLAGEPPVLQNRVLVITFFAPT